MLNIENTGAISKPLPLIRGDLEIYEGPKDLDFMPSWTIHDPLRHRYFKIGYLEFKLLAFWKEGNAEKISQKIEKETTLEIDSEQIFSFAQFLEMNYLTIQSDPKVHTKFMDFVQRQKKSIFFELLKNYLFFRIPIIHPSNFLNSTLKYVKFMFSKTFFIISFVLLIVSLYLISRQFDEFIHTFIYSFTLEGLIIYAIALFFAKVIHEFGHAYTATYYGVKVPTMGIAFLVMWPVLYTDTTQIWKVVDKKARLAVGAAGMIAELLLAIYASLLWHFAPPGPIQSAAFALATVTWVITLAINLSPFMRFDGYYLLSDYLGVENLQERSFALAKWQMREFIFNYKTPRPEFFSSKLHRILLIYAYCTWIYRFFIFLGIAFLVYYFFFKLLGIFLMLVELIWFVFLPIGKEMGVWYKMRSKARWSLSGVISLIILCTSIGLLFIPFKTSVDAPTFVHNPTSFKIYPAVSAQIAKVNVLQGDPVQKDDPLIELSALELNFLKNKAEEKIKILKYQLEHQVLDETRAQNIKVLEQQLEQAIAELQSTSEQLKNTIIRAPFDGFVAELDEILRPGLWVNTKWPLGIILKPQKSLFEAYVLEDDLRHVEKSQKAIFYPDNIDLKAIPLTLINLEKTNSIILNRPELASLYKGEIAVEKDEKGRLIPKKAIYKSVFEAENNIPILLQTQRGTTKIESDKHNLIARLWRLVASVLIRESGF
jgi:putative peptide zinc metalloprotease protein